MEQVFELIPVLYLPKSEIANIAYILDSSKTVNSVKLILGLSKFQIQNAAAWRDTILGGSIGTTKNESYVPLNKLAKSPAFFQ